MILILNMIPNMAASTTFTKWIRLLLLPLLSTVIICHFLHVWMDLIHRQQLILWCPSNGNTNTKWNEKQPCSGVVIVFVFYLFIAVVFCTLTSAIYSESSDVTGRGHRRIGGQNLRAINNMSSPAAAPCPTAGTAVSKLTAAGHRRRCDARIQVYCK